MNENREENQDRKSAWSGTGCAVMGMIVLILYVFSPPWVLKIGLALPIGATPQTLTQKIEWIYPAHVWLHENNDTFSKIWLEYVSLYDL